MPASGAEHPFDVNLSEVRRMVAAPDKQPEWRTNPRTQSHRAKITKYLNDLEDVVLAQQQELIRLRSLLVEDRQEDTLRSKPISYRSDRARRFGKEDRSKLDDEIGIEVAVEV